MRRSNEKQSEDRRKQHSPMTTADMVTVSMFAAVLAIISQIALPVGAVPITIQVFGVVLVGVVLGAKRGAIATLVYILLGAVGLPIFSGFRGGLQVILGTTGGYILAWPLVTFLAGWEIREVQGIRRYVLRILPAVTGMMVMELAGGFQWYMLTKGGEGAMTYGAIMAYSFAAFIPKDTVLTVLAVILGERIRRILLRAGL